MLAGSAEVETPIASMLKPSGFEFRVSFFGQGRGLEGLRLQKTNSGRGKGGAESLWAQDGSRRFQGFGPQGFWFISSGGGGYTREIVGVSWLRVLQGSPLQLLNCNLTWVGVREL